MLQDDIPTRSACKTVAEDVVGELHGGGGFLQVGVHNIPQFPPQRERNPEAVVGELRGCGGFLPIGVQNLQQVHNIPNVVGLPTHSERRNLHCCGGFVTWSCMEMYGVVGSSRVWYCRWLGCGRMLWFAACFANL